MQTSNIVNQRRPSPAPGIAPALSRRRNGISAGVLVVVNSRTAVFHAEQHGVAVAMQAKRDRSIFRGIANGIVEQVSAQLPSRTLSPATYTADCSPS